MPNKRFERDAPAAPSLAGCAPLKPNDGRRIYTKRFILALAPKLYQSTPISGDSQPAKSGYAARVTVLAAMGLVLALLANVVVYVLGRFS